MPARKNRYHVPRVIPRVPTRATTVIADRYCGIKRDRRREGEERELRSYALARAD